MTRSMFVFSIFVLGVCWCQCVHGYPQRSSGPQSQEIVVVDEVVHYSPSSGPATLQNVSVALITHNAEQPQAAVHVADNESSAPHREDDLIFAVKKPQQQQPSQSDEVYQIDLLTSAEEDSLTSVSTSISAEEQDADGDGDGHGDAIVDGVPREIELRKEHTRTAARPIDMSDFVALIPAAEVKAIADNYYRHDAEVQRAYAFLSGNQFAALKQRFIELPEMAAFLHYLNSSGLDVVGFVYSITNLTNKAAAAQPTEGTGTTEGKGRPVVVAMELGGLENEIAQSQSVTTATTPTTKATATTTANQLSSNNFTTNTTTLPTVDTVAATTAKEPLNGLHGLVDSILDVLPQDQVLTTFFYKLESDEQFAKLVDNIGSPIFAKILNDLENSVSLRNLIFTLHNNGIYITRIVDSLKAYFFLGTF